MRSHFNIQTTLTAIATMLLFSSLVFSDPVPTTRPNFGVLKIAHRGAKEFTPENTLPAIKLAIKLGFDYVEMDVRYTKDGVAVLMHDFNVDRTTFSHGKLEDMTLEEIKKLDAGRGYPQNPGKFKNTPVPTLEEALQVMQGKINLYYDQKAPIRDETIEMLKKYGFYPDKMVMTGGLEKHMELLSRHPDAPVMMNIGSLEAIPGILEKLPSIRAFDTNCMNVTDKYIDAAHEAGVMVFTDTLAFCESKKQMRDIINTGIDGIQTDKPKLLLKVIKKMKLKKQENQDSLRGEK